jgi:hypothetical protein
MGTVLKAPGHPELVGKTNVTVPDFSQHPNILVQAGRWQSTAAGRYQFLNRTWNGLGLPKWGNSCGGLQLTITAVKLFSAGAQSAKCISTMTMAAWTIHRISAMLDMIGRTVGRCKWIFRSNQRFSSFG